MIILYLIYINIISNNAIRSRVIIFIKKDNINYIIIISKLNIYQEFDVQILDISRYDLLNILLFNVYNKKQIDSENDKYIINRVLSKIDLLIKSIIYSDFNIYIYFFILFLHFCMQPKAITIIKNFLGPNHVTRPPCNHIYNARFFL